MSVSNRHRIVSLGKHFESLIGQRKIAKVRVVDAPAPHATLMGVKTKQTVIAIGLGNTEDAIEVVVSFSLTHKDSLIADHLQDLVHGVLATVGPNPILLAKQSFHISDKDRGFLSEDKKNFLLVLKDYVKIATDFLWDETNFINED